jgi:hypothetical protein
MYETHQPYSLLLISFVHPPPHTVLCSTPSIVLLCPFTSHPPFATAFNNASLYPLPSHLMLYCRTDALSFSFLSSMESFHCSKHVLHMGLYMIMLIFVYMFIFGSIFHIWEKTCGLCVSEPGLLHLTWCPPIPSIYLQTTCLFLMLE